MNSWPLVAMVGIVCLTIVVLFMIYMGARYHDPPPIKRKPKTPQMSRELPEESDTGEWPQQAER